MSHVDISQVLQGHIIMSQLPGAELDTLFNESVAPILPALAIHAQYPPNEVDSYLTHPTASDCVLGAREGDRLADVQLPG